MVEWTDTSMHEGWFGGEDEIPTEPLACKTLGWLLYRDEMVVVISMTVAGAEIGDIMIIPKPSIVDIHIQKEPK